MKQFLLALTLLTLGFFIQTPSAQAQSSIGFSDTLLKVKSFYPLESEWVILTTNNRAFYYAKPQAESVNLDSFQWSYTVKAADFNGSVWTDSAFVYFGYNNYVDRVNKADGKLLEKLPFQGVCAAPYFNGTHFFLGAKVKGKYMQLCVVPKKMKVLWSFPIDEDFCDPIYTSHAIITRDTTGHPITIDYAKGKVTVPPVFVDKFPFRTWSEMFVLHGNEPSDSLFMYNGWLYAMNPYTGYLKRFKPENYPVADLRIDMSRFASKAPFVFSMHPEGALYHSHQGIHLLVNEELDSLQRIPRKDGNGAKMVVVPLSQSHFYKIKGTTQMGNFNDFGTAKFITILENRYIVFEQNGQMIGVSTVGARTFNFPKLSFSIQDFALFEDVIFFAAKGVPFLLRAKIERIMTEEELKQLEPSPEIKEMLRQLEAGHTPVPLPKK